MSIGWSWLLAAAGIAGCVRLLFRVRKARKELTRICRDAGLESGHRVQVIITGATRGIGFALADTLSHYKVELVLGVRDVAAGNEMKQQWTAAGRPALVWVFPADHLDLGQMVTFHNLTMNVLGPSGDCILINNAGVMKPACHTSRQRIDAAWQTNFLAPFQLTEMFAKSKKPMRVLCVASSLEKFSKLLEYDPSHLLAVSRADLRTPAQQKVTYQDSKRALMMWAQVRAQLLYDESQLSLFMVSPGMINTDLGRTSINPLLFKMSWPLRALLLPPPEEGAIPILEAAFSKDLKNKYGWYLRGSPLKKVEDLTVQRAKHPMANAVVDWAWRVSEA